MKTSEQIDKLVEALATAKGKFQAIGKAKTAEVRSDKGSFSYHYADLAAAIEATGPALNECGLAVMQPTRTDGQAIVVTTLLAHKSGQWISEEMSWPAGNDTRARGSAVTYARRHGYLSMIGAAAQDDDDAAAAETSRPQRKQAPPRQQTPNREAAGAVQRATMPQTGPLRAANLKTRLAKLGVKPSQMAEKLGEWIARPINDTNEFSSDDWMRANEGIGELEAKAAVLARPDELDQRSH